MTENHQDPEQTPPPPKTESPAESFFTDFETAVRKELEGVKPRMEEIRKGLEEECARVGEGLEKSRERLAALFQQSDQEIEPSRLITEIEGQLIWINRKLRAGIDKEIRNLSPRRKPIASILAALSRHCREAAVQLPERPTAPADEGSSANLARQLWNRLLVRVGIPPRLLVEELLPTDPGAHPLVRRHGDLHQEALARFADLWRGIRFHLEVAIDDLKKRAAPPEEAPSEGEEEGETSTPSETADQVLGALSDGREQIRRALAPLFAFYEELPAALEKSHREFVIRLRSELASAGEPRHILTYLWRRLLRSLSDKWQRGQELIEQGKDEVSRTASSGLTQTGHLLRNLQSLVGRPGQTADALLHLTDLPTTSQVLERARDLPSLYRRLFTLGPLKNREFLVAREEEMETLEEIARRWRDGKTCSAALIGPEGSGKTSLINCFVSEFCVGEEVLRLDVARRMRSEQDALELFTRWLEPGEPFASLEGVIEHLLSGPRRILVVEGGHHLALRVIGGYRGARAFFYVLMATRRHILWVVTFRRYPWTRLDYQLGIAQYFTHQVRTLFHTQEELQETILLRHRTSGVPLFYHPREEGGPDEEDQPTRQSRFFKDLFAATSGNIDAALYYWLLCLEYDEGEQTLKICPLGKLDYGFLRALGRDYLFALGEVHSHGGLTPEEYSEIFRKTPLEARLLLDYLAQLNLLQAEGRGEGGLATRYQLNPVFFGPVSTQLESMNILY